MLLMVEKDIRGMLFIDIHVMLFINMQKLLANILKIMMKIENPRILSIGI